MYNYKRIRQGRAGKCLCVVLQILRCSLWAVPLRFLGVKWISGPHLLTCNQGRGRRPCTQQRAVAAQQKVKLKRRTALQGSGGANWLAVPGEAWGPRGELGAPQSSPHFSLLLRVFHGSPSVLLTMNVKGVSHG